MGLDNKLQNDIKLRFIIGTDNKYAAGSDGHIYCFSKARNNSRKPYPFQVKEHIGSNGYYFISFILSSKRKSMPVHVLVCQAFNGAKPDPKMVTRHLDGDKLNNLPGNLCWGTYAENEADKKRHGNTACGEKQGSAKLNDYAVEIIRKSIPYGLWDSVNAAKVFGVTPSTINRIARGVGWSHVN